MHRNKIEHMHNIKGKEDLCRRKRSKQRKMGTKRVIQGRKGEKYCVSSLTHAATYYRVCSYNVYGCIYTLRGRKRTGGHGERGSNKGTITLSPPSVCYVRFCLASIKEQISSSSSSFPRAEGRMPFNTPSPNA